LATDSEHIDYLISRYLAGESTDDERLQLERWMEESDVNRKYFSDIRFMHDKVVSSHQVKRVNVDKAWNNVRQQMHLPVVKKNRGLVYMPPWLRIAAVIVLFFGVAFWLYTSYFSTSDKALVIASQANPVNYNLADSSQVILSKNSKITCTAHFGRKMREVTLSGEANFNVRHMEELPFIVQAEGTFIKDIGTSFIVKANPASAIVEVFVETGEVAFYSRDDAGVKLLKGETGIYEKATKTFRKYNVMENIILKESKVLIFQNAELSYVIDQLAEIYHINIQISNAELANCKITVSFDGENIGAIVGIITETLGLKGIKTTDGYMLLGENCNSR
jgi:transmembrane sensor